MARPGVESKTATPREYLLDTMHVVRKNILISSTARDAMETDGSTARVPTTQLRRGLVLSKITVGGKYAQYDNTAHDGTEVADCILDQDVDLLDNEGTPQDTPAVAAIHCYADESELLGIDANGKTDLTHVMFG
jgi:hypothetical protein